MAAARKKEDKKTPSSAPSEVRIDINDDDLITPYQMMPMDEKNSLNAEVKTPQSQAKIEEQKKLAHQQITQDVKLELEILQAVRNQIRSLKQVYSDSLFNTLKKQEDTWFNTFFGGGYKDAFNKISALPNELEKITKQLSNSRVISERINLCGSALMESSGNKAALSQALKNAQQMREEVHKETKSFLVEMSAKLNALANDTNDKFIIPTIKESIDELIESFYEKTVSLYKAP